MIDKKNLKKIELEPTQNFEIESEMKSPNAQTISEININVDFISVNRQSAEEYLEEYRHCPLCGAELIYSHVTQFIYSQVTEEAHCEKCNVCTKKNQHSLH